MDCQNSILLHSIRFGPWEALLRSKQKKKGQSIYSPGSLPSGLQVGSSCVFLLKATAQLHYSLVLVTCQYTYSFSLEVQTISLRLVQSASSPHVAVSTYLKLANTFNIKGSLIILFDYAFLLQCISRSMYYIYIHIYIIICIIIYIIVYIMRKSLRPTLPTYLPHRESLQFQLKSFKKSITKRKVIVT